MNHRTWTQPPDVGDPEANSVARQLGVILLGWIVLLVPVIVMTIELGFAPLRVTLAVGVLAIGVCALLLELSRRGSPKLASALLGLSLWVMTWYVAAGSGGIWAPVVAANIALCHQMGVLLGLRAGLVSALICSVTVLILARIEAAGLTPTLMTSTSPYRTWVTFSFFMAQAVVIEHVSRAEVKRALAKALHAVEEHARAERALSRRTIELTAQAHELTAAKKKAEVALRAESSFLAMMSHEIRTPLAAMQGGLRLLEMGAMGELGADAQEAVGISLRNTGRLIDLVNELLDLQLIQAGQLRLAPEPVELTGLVRDTIARLVPTADEHEVRVTTTLPAEALTIESDRARLGQALAQLITNAIQFAGEAKQIEVRVASEPEQVRLLVTNWGAPIEDTVRGRMFSPFQQGIRGSTRKTGGVGVGLPIAKAIVDLHGGDISYRSDTTETTFQITLPRVPLMPSACLTSVAPAA